MNKPIRMALTKGRLEKDTVGLLEKLAVTISRLRPSLALTETRRLI